MYGAGCAKELASWIIHGRSELPMDNYDIRRFTKKQRSSHEWIVERSHEAYATNYGIVFPYNQPLAGRNLEVDSLHEVRLCNVFLIFEGVLFAFSDFLLKICQH